MMGARIPTKKEVDLFEKLLFCDTFRGPHSTGVFSRREYVMQHRENEIVYPMSKLAVTGPEYLMSDTWKQQRSGIFTTPKLANFYVGHNRYATVGAINATNAHPFRHGDITMVHNGTLADQSLLPDSDKFEVDSDNVCYSLDKWGVDRTVQNLDGAFTIIWHNRKDETLHIIRNDERPFHLAESASGDWFGASEEDMLMWILKRGKAGVNIKRHFETVPGTEYIFDVDGTFVLKEERKHVLPVFQKYWAATRWSSTNTTRTGSLPATVGKRSNAAATSGTSLSSKQSGLVLEKTVHDKINNTLKQFGVDAKINGLIRFIPFDYEPYVKSGNAYAQRGKLLGYLDDVEAYVEIVVHGVEADGFEITRDKLTPAWGTIVGAYDNSGYLTVVVQNATATPPEVFDTTTGEIHQESEKCDEQSTETQEEPEELEEETLELEGQTYTQSEWAARSNTDCGNCSSPIPWQDIESCATLHDAVICPGCVEEVFQEELEEDAETATFICLGCSEEVPFYQEALPYKRTCKDCVHAFIPNPVFTPKPLQVEDVESKILMNGNSVTPKVWSMMNECKCGAALHWEAADAYEIRGGICICEDCSNALDKKEGK